MGFFASGVVKEKDGSGLGGVTVTVSGPALPQGRTTTTQPDGSFSFSDLPYGEGYHVEASAGGQLVMNPPTDPLAQRLNAAASHLDAVTARLTDLNNSLKLQDQAAEEAAGDQWALAEKIDAVRRYRDYGGDITDEVEDHVSNAPSGLGKLIGLVAGFAAGWKVGGIKK